MRVVGLDIGGSKTHAISRITTPAGEAHDAEAFAGSANLQSVGEVAAGAQLDAVLTALVAQGHDAPVDVVVAGAAGADSPATIAPLVQLLSERMPAARVSVVHDTRLVLATEGAEHGIALIAGTGSVAWGLARDGRTARAGGWGYLLGDEGSGYGIAKDAVRHTLLRADQGLGPDRLTAALLDSCSVAEPLDLIGHLYGRPERRYWAQQSEVVFAVAADGDPAAARIVTAAAVALGTLVGQVGDRLGGDGSWPVFLAGGVATHQPLLVDALTTELARRGFGDVRTIHHAPVVGALNLALAQAGAHPTPHQGDRL